MLTRWILILTLLLIFQGSFSQKTDRITVSNGNKITGEIKKLEYGKLTYKTDDIGTISVNWNKVIYIKSDKIFEIETSQGYLFIGNLQETADTGLVFIQAGNAGTEVRLIDITFIYPIKSRFFDRIAGPVSMGFGYTKSNQLLQLTYDGDLNYRGKRIYSGITLSGAYTQQYDSIFTQRQYYAFKAGKNFRKHWYTGGLIGYEQNSELGIESRVNLGVQVGRTMIQSNSNNLNTSIAVQGTREYYYSETPTANNIELFIDVKYKHFLYYSPKSDITTEAQFLPNLTSWGRYRANFTIGLNQEVFKDFFWSLNFYINYDNKPPDDETPTTDWGITTGLGYTF